MDWNQRYYFGLVALICIGMGLFVRRLRLRMGRNRYAPQWFAYIWRVSLVVLGLVLVIAVLRAAYPMPG
jgi:hypothetical protein